MSDFVPKPKLVFDDSTVAHPVWGEEFNVRRVSDQEQIARALISIANSLAILADEADEMTPIVHAAFIVGDAMNADPPEEAVVPGKGRVS